MKKVLFLSYYWPPDQGAGVQRAFQFCKYLPEFGYDPIVLTANPKAENAEIADYWFRPAEWMGGKSGGGSSAPSKASTAAKLKRSLLQFVWMNAFIPDSRTGWRSSAIAKASQLIQEHQPEALYTTAPPYTILLVGRELKKRFGLPWLVDFRDPWVENHAYNQSFRFRWVRNINQRMEQSVLNLADTVICATHHQSLLLAAKAGGTPVHTITNGYDPGQWPPDTPLKPLDTFTVSHFGTMYGDGCPLEVFDTLHRFLEEHPEDAQRIRFRFTNTIAPTVLERIRQCIPEKNLELLPPVPQPQAVEMMKEQQVLLLITNSGDMHRYSLPSKIFEYRASGNPILGVGPADHDVREFITSAPEAVYLKEHDQDQILDFLSSKFERWKSNALPSRTQSISSINRKNLTGRLAREFDQALANA